MDGKKLIFMGRDMRNETIYDLDPRKNVAEKQFINSSSSAEKRVC
jgi:hypothetical protein